MTTLRARAVLNGLTKKGFLPSEGDHTRLIFYYKGKKTSVRTKLSHGSSEIGDRLINLMSIQVKLEKDKFVDLVNCPLGIDEYIKELSAQGISFC